MTNRYQDGYEAGQAAGSWVLDGNSSREDALRIWDGYNDGDPEVMDIQPAPLSGEMAGESMVEILGEDVDDEEAADTYEEGYAAGFWDEVLAMARSIGGVDA